MLLTRCPKSGILSCAAAGTSGHDPVGGFNVFPRNIEEAIYEHPGVAEVIVIGIPDAYRGQSAKTFIALRPGHPPVRDR
jgi:hypothetical protein